MAEDLNPDPDIVEVELVAQEGTVHFGPGHQLSQVWTYNGSIPGPMIEANVGNTLIVHFYNELPEETTIHWHGVELPANMDGSNISQEAVPPGGYFRYEFDLLRAALYWYHPHVRSNEQVEKGLYGALLVHDPATNDELDLPDRESVWVLDDILLDAHGRVTEPFPDDPLENAEMQVNGREGNVLLVNGKSNQKQIVRRGYPHRIRIVNTANSRFMRVSIEGHRMWRIGGDAGLLESPIEILPIEQVPEPDPDRGLLLTPGERADIIFVPQTHGPIEVQWHDWFRGRHSVFYKEDGSIGLGDADDDGMRSPKTLLTLISTGPPRTPNYTPPSTLNDITPIDPSGAAPIPVTFGHTPPDENGDITFFTMMKNGMPLPFDQITAADAPIVTPGETRIWEVTNMTGGDHNFHTHGFMFQPIEIEFVDMDNSDNNYTVPAPYLEEKDTFRIPKRPGARGRSRTIARFAVTFDDTGREGQITASGKDPDENTSGGWVFHCHILEHADLGMMNFLQVVDSPPELPVELTRFTATRNDDAVHLSWKTASETNNSGFEIQRLSSQAEEWISLGFIAGAGTTNQPQTYRFRDEAWPFNAGTLTYRLKQIDFNGDFELSPKVEVALAKPERITLHPIFPNPATQAVSIPYEIPQATHVRLEVFDMTGRRVATLVQRDQPSGSSVARFDTSHLASGLYIVRLEARGVTTTQRMTVVR